MMSGRTSRNAWITLVVGVALVVLSMYWFSTIYGAGPTFPPSQLYTWPVSVVGGVMVGYAIADLAPFGGGRLPRIVLALVGGSVAFNGQVYIQAYIGPAIEFGPSGGGLVTAVVVVAVIEGYTRYYGR